MFFWGKITYAGSCLTQGKYLHFQTTIRLSDLIAAYKGADKRKMHCLTSKEPTDCLLNKWKRMHKQIKIKEKYEVGHCLTSKCATVRLSNYSAGNFQHSGWSSTETWEQACKLSRSDSFLQNLKTLLTHSLTDQPTDRDMRGDAIASKIISRLKYLQSNTHLCF